MRPLEFNMNVGRTQDISPIKQAQEEKPVIMQQQIINSNEKAAEVKQQRVYQNRIRIWILNMTPVRKALERNIRITARNIIRIKMKKTDRLRLKDMPF